MNPVVEVLREKGVVLAGRRGLSLDGLRLYGINKRVVDQAVKDGLVSVYDLLNRSRGEVKPSKFYSIPMNEGDSK